MSLRATSFERSEPVAGVKLVTESMPHVRSASVGFFVEIGSRDEPARLAGAAHLLEHLLFKGTTTRSARELANVFDAVGGEVNAYTSKEETVLYARVLDDDLPMAVDVLCDLFRNATLRADDLESERKVVLEEILMTADQPEDWVHEIFGELVWPDHALGRPVIGTAQTVEALDVADLSGFYRDSYVPDRLVVAAAGNVRHEALASMLAEGLSPGTSSVRRAPTEAPLFANHVTTYLPHDTEQAHIVWGTEALGRRDPDRYALSVLNSHYGGGTSSRLFQEVREKRGLVYSIYSAYQLHVEVGLFGVYAGTQPAQAREVLDIVREEAATIAAGGVTEAEVELAKGQLKGGLVLSMDDPGGRMGRLGSSELVHGEVLTVDELLARIDAVTPEDVTRVGKRVFLGGGGALACVGPAEDGSLDFAVEPLRH